MSDEALDVRNGRLRIAPGTVVQIVVYVIALVLTYGALDKRIAALEIKYDRIAQDLAEIKADTKQLLQRLGGRP
jgi:F0F1-type ATP synthase membrane subunit b/b'